MKRNALIITSAIVAGIPATMHAVVFDASSTVSLSGNTISQDASDDSIVDTGANDSNAQGSAESWARGFIAGGGALDFGVSATGRGGDNANPTDTFYSATGDILVAETYFNTTGTTEIVRLDAAIYPGGVEGIGPLVLEEFQEATVEIEIVALSLVGADPIPVGATSLWQVEVALSRSALGNTFAETSSLGNSLGGSFTEAVLDIPQLFSTIIGGVRRDRC